MQPIKFSFVKTGGLLKQKEAVKVCVIEGKSDETVREAGVRTINVGVEKGKINRRKLEILPRKIISLAKAAKAKTLVLNLGDFLFKGTELSPEETAEVLATNFELANYQFVSYKSKPEDGWNFIEKIIVVGGDKKSAQDGFLRGQKIGFEMNASRELANTPGGEMTPSLLAKEAVSAARGTKVKVKVLGKKDIQKLNMGGILGVAKGSEEEPKFIVMEYWGSSKSEKPTVLVGKGVTFDTGGINLKPSDSLLGMNLDMAGGAVVIHTVVAAAKLGVNKNIIGLIPAVENMPSGASYRPGDILKTMSGKTIEVLNTDAEGRIILADALTYAERYKPATVIDVATLTGAALVALGERASAIFSKDEKLIEQLREAGEMGGNYVWPLPLWDEYEEDIKGKFGDVVNTNVTHSRYGGSINGAMFLYQFAKNYRWAHIDMAPRMEAIKSDVLSDGSTGEPLRLLLKFLEKFA